MSAPAFEQIALAALRVWSGNPRKIINARALDELTESVREKGVTVPLLVRPVAPPEGAITHEIIAGQRRFTAAKVVFEDEATVPCIVHELDDAAALELALLENAARADIDPIEEAEAIERLIGLDRTVQQVADRLGHHFTWIEKRRKLLGLSEVARAWVRTREVPLAHAQALATVPHVVQARVIESFGASEVPGSRQFLVRIRDYLHELDRAPFDVAATSLPGGPCAKCTKRSDRQMGLFGDVAAAGASCLDPACWDTKVAAVWAAAEKSAKKRKLTVIADPREVFSWGDQPKGGSPYTAHAPADAALKPVAIARTDDGRVVELYAREAVAAANKKALEDEDEDEDEGDDEAPREKPISEWQRKRQENAARVAAQLARISKGLSNPARFDDVARMLMEEEHRDGNVRFADEARVAMGLAPGERAPVGRSIEALLLTLLSEGLKHEGPHPEETEAWVRGLAGEQPLAPLYVPAGPRKLSLKRGDWLQHRKGLLDAKGLALHKKWETSPYTEARTIVLEQGETLDHVLGYASAHELALDVQPAERDHVDEDEEEGAPHG